MINLTNLQVYITVANLGSLRKAAKVLHLTQPGITNQIKSLEKFLDVKLFDRNIQGVKLTSAGKLFYRYAENFLSLYNKLETDLKSLCNKPQDTLLLGATCSLGHYPLPDCLINFTTVNPFIKIDYRVAPKREIIKLIKENKLDVAIVEGPVRDDRLISFNIDDDEIIVLAPPTGRWEGKTEVTFEELKEFPFFSHTHGCGVMELFKGALASQGYIFSEMPCMLELNYYPSIINLVMDGKGLSVGSKMSVSKQIEIGAIIPLKIKGLDIPVNYQMACLPDKINKYSIRQFSAFLNQEENGHAVFYKSLTDSHQGQKIAVK